MGQVRGLMAGLTCLLLSACQDGPAADSDAIPPEPAPAAASSTPAFSVDVDYHRLDNGLRVVLSQDGSVPTATVAVYYGIGARTEPPGRSGFAHLAEHLMFQGSRNLPRGEFDRLVYGAGGVAGGATRLDYTAFQAVIPTGALHALLWAEADRMAGPALDQAALDTQREVVRNEVMRNVMNQPYGGWLSIDLPAAAFENPLNGRSVYGDMDDLDTATLADARAFFERYYTPGNAVLVVAGDIDKPQTLAWIEALFGAIPPGEDPPEIDRSEPRQEGERFASVQDALARQPALAVGYHMPERGTPEYYAMLIADQILLQGDDSRLVRALVDERGYASGLLGGVNLLGTGFNYDGPMLWTVGLVHDREVAVTEVLAALDATIETLRAEEVDPAEIDRARTKLLSGFYTRVDSATRFGLVDLLAALALFDDAPERINGVIAEFDRVTPGLLRATTQEYLRRGNRTVLEVRPDRDPPATEAATDTDR